MDDVPDAHCFSHLRRSDELKLAALCREGKRDQVAALFLEWLSGWSDEAWIDHERIYFHLRDLYAMGVWSQSTYGMFVAQAQACVCNTVTQYLIDQNPTVRT